MIFTDRTITVRKGESRIDEPIVVYRGDYELEVRFTILNSRFKFMSGINMIESEKASYGQLAILTPYGGNIFSGIVRCNDGSVTFVLTAEMLNQIEEVGLYSFQIRLMDYNKESRVSIPPIEFGIEVREPIASEDHDNSVNNAIVGYSIAKVVDPKEENVSDTFDESGNYNKTKWETGDRISQGKLNKIEDAIDKINENEVNNTAVLSKRIDNNFNVLDSTKADKNEIFHMANMGQDVKEAMTGGSVAVVGKNTILNENIVDGQIDIEHTKFIKQKEVSLLGKSNDGYIIYYDGSYVVTTTGLPLYAFIYKIDPVRRYKVKAVNNDRLRVATAGNLSYGPDTLICPNIIINDDSKNAVEFTSPSTGEYLYVYIDASQVNGAYCTVYDLDAPVDITYKTASESVIEQINKINSRCSYGSVSITPDPVKQYTLNKMDESVYLTHNFRVKKNTNYRVVIRGDWNRFRVGGFHSNVNIQTSESAIKIDKMIFTDDQYYDNIVFNSGDCVDIWIYTTNASLSCEVELYECGNLKVGGLELAYKEEIDLSGKGKQIQLTGNYYSIGVINNDLGLYLAAEANGIFNTYNFRVEKNTDYRVVIRGDWNRFRVGGFHNTVNIMEIGIEKWYFDEVIINDDTGYYDNIVFNSGNCVDIWIYTSNDSLHYPVELYTYEPLVINDREVLSSDEVRLEIKNATENIEGASFKFFTKPEGYWRFVEIPGYDNSLTATTYYELFDTLNYSSTEILGYESVTNLPIRKYVFEPTFVDEFRDSTTKVNFRVPTVLLNSTIHGGDEKLTCWIAYHFFKLLETTTDENLLWLKNHVRFITIPMINPWGFDHGCRENGNGIDLNREFLKNESDMQEEARLLKVFADNNEFDVLIDLHTMWAGKDKHSAWLISADDDFISFDNDLILYLTQQWKNRYPFMPQDNTLFGYAGQPDYIEPAMQASQFRNYCHSKGVKRSVTLEIANTITYNNETRYGPLTTNMYFEILVNYVLGIVRTLL